MSSCPKFEQLNELVDGACDTSVRRHFDRCPACKREVRRLLAVKVAVGMADAGVFSSPALRRALVARLRR